MGQLYSVLFEPLPLPGPALEPSADPALPLHKLLLCLQWLPSSSLLAAELCCRELRALVLQRGFFPSLCLHEDDFLGNCENVVAWLEQRAGQAGSQNLAHLETLRLSAMPTLTEAHVSRLLKICPQLKYMDISKNEETLSTQVVDLLREAAPPLEALVLPTLRVSHFRAVSTLSRFPKLQFLDLSLHQPVTSAIIQSSKLVSLRLTGPLQEDLLKLLSGGGLPHLEDVWLLCCPGPVLADLAQHCPLKSIGVSVEPPCDFDSLTRIIQASGSRLRHLNIPSRLQPQSGPLTRNIGDLLAEHCPRLQYLCMHTATMPLTTQGLAQLLKGCRKLQRVSLSHVQGSCRGPGEASEGTKRLALASCGLSSLMSSPFALWLDEPLADLKLERLPNYCPSSEEIAKLMAAAAMSQEPLRSLRLAHLPKLPAEALQQLLSISSLTSLSLCNVDVPDDVWQQLPKMQGLRDLTVQRRAPPNYSSGEERWMRTSPAVERALLQVVQCCSRLRKLDLYGMQSAITDRLCLLLLHSNRTWPHGSGLRFLRLDLRYGAASEEVLHALKASALPSMPVRILPQDSSSTSVLPGLVKAQAQVRGYLVRRESDSRKQYMFSFASCCIQ